MNAILDEEVAAQPTIREELKRFMHNRIGIHAFECEKDCRMKVNPNKPQRYINGRWMRK